MIIYIYILLLLIKSYCISVYAKLGHGHLAKEYHEQYIKMLNSNSTTKEKTHAYEQMGNTYTILKDYDHAISIFQVLYVMRYLFINLVIIIFNLANRISDLFLNI